MSSHTYTLQLTVSELLELEVLVGMMINKYHKFCNDSQSSATEQQYWQSRIEILESIKQKLGEA